MNLICLLYILTDDKTDCEMKPLEDIIIEDHTSRNKVYDLYAMTVGDKI